MQPHLFHGSEPPAVRVAALGDLGGAIGAALLAIRLSEQGLARARRTLAGFLRPVAHGLGGVVAASLGRQRVRVARGVVLVAIAGALWWGFRMNGFTRVRSFVSQLTGGESQPAPAAPKAASREAMTGTPNLALAFAAGFVSFVSPCCLPLVPGYLAVITGNNPPTDSRRARARLLARSALFVTSFSTIFIIAGLSATFLGSFLNTNRPTLERISGAVIVALGHHRAGMFSNNDELADRLVEAGEAVGEQVWRLPLDESYDREIDSDAADVKNIAGDRAAGSIIGAQFLKRFVNGVPWAHLDIAGVAWSKKDAPTVPKGATAFGVRLLDRFVADYCEK